MNTALTSGWSRPPKLEPGDLAAVVATSSPVPREALQRGVAEMARLGLRVRLRSDIGERNEAWSDPEARAVWAARGGAGAIELLPDAGRDLPADRRLVFCGYSDLTYLHALLQRRRVVTFYGPMVSFEMARGDGAEGGYDGALLRRLLFQGEPGGPISGPAVATLCGGVAEGRLTGGCLSLLSTLAGTPEALDTDDAVLFLEDEKEPPHRLHRYLHHLRRTGAFANVRAVVLGQFPESEPVPAGGPSARQVLREFFADFPGPVLWGLPIGHTTGPLVTLPYGVWARLDGDAGVLDLLEPAVE
jgi:muramoyltetrapeptide carboxypeptidase